PVGQGGGAGHGGVHAATCGPAEAARRADEPPGEEGERTGRGGGRRPSSVRGGDLEAARQAEEAWPCSGFPCVTVTHPTASDTINPNLDPALHLSTRDQPVVGHAPIACP